MIARRIVVEGRVQGVGFRDAMCTSAHIHRVRGWVRNRRDGRVEALVQGDDEAVALVIAWARRGPPAARVARVAETPLEPRYAGSYDRFERWPSA